VGKKKQRVVSVLLLSPPPRPWVLTREGVVVLVPVLQ
jgi:hypothetical protein